MADLQKIVDDLSSQPALPDFTQVSSLAGSGNAAAAEAPSAASAVAAGQGHTTHGFMGDDGVGYIV